MNFKLFRCRSAINNVFQLHTKADKSGEVEIFCWMYGFLRSSCCHWRFEFVMNSSGLKMFDLFWSILLALLVTWHVKSTTTRERVEWLKFHATFWHLFASSPACIYDNKRVNCDFPFGNSLHMIIKIMLESCTAKSLRVMMHPRKKSWSEMWRLNRKHLDFYCLSRRDNLRQMTRSTFGNCRFNEMLTELQNKIVTSLAMTCYYCKTAPLIKFWLGKGVVHNIGHAWCEY